MWNMNEYELLLVIKHHVDETATTVCWTNLDKDLIPTTGCPPKTKNLGKFDTTPAIGVSQLLVGIQWAKLDAEIGSHRSNYLHLPQVLLLIRNLEFTFNIYVCVWSMFVQTMRFMNLILPPKKKKPLLNTKNPDEPSIRIKKHGNMFHSKTSKTWSFHDFPSLDPGGQAFHLRDDEGQGPGCGEEMRRLDGDAVHQHGQRVRTHLDSWERYIDR